METEHLNSAQKRAQVIKDELQQFDSDHLDTFIDGVEAIEPPKYRRVGAKIVPDLVMVKLKKGAETYNIGNVYFDEADEIVNIKFRIDTAVPKFKVDRSDRLPKERGNPLATPIYQFVAQEFTQLWRVKYQRIVEHKDIINEKRQFAHNMFNQPPRRSMDGKAPGTQMSGYANQEDRMNNATKFRKRLSGEPVAQHPSNKRARVGLLAMSDTIKCETFAKIEDRFKVELFDAMVKAAFPGFDNVMTAAWNVVSVYTAVGSKFKGLHEAVTDLKDVLDEFDAVQGDAQPKTAMRVKENRDHSTTDHRNGRKAATSTSEGPMEGIVREGRPTLPSPPRQDVIKKSAIFSDWSEEAQKIVRPTVGNVEEDSDDEARKEKFNDIKRRIEAKPRYTPTPHLAPMHEREGSAVRIDITTPDENEHIPQQSEQNGTPQEAGQAEENFDNNEPEDVPKTSDPDKYHMRLKQEEREASEFKRMNEREIQYQHQPQHRPQHEHQEHLQFNQNGRGAYDTTKPAHEAARESRDSRGPREKGNERISPVDNNQQSFNQNRTFDYPQARQQEPRKPQPPADKSKATSGVWFGSSMLGAKKSPSTANAAAPVALMAHNMQNGSEHATRKDVNGTERRRPQ